MKTVEDRIAELRKQVFAKTLKPTEFIAKVAELRGTIRRSDEEVLEEQRRQFASNLHQM